MFNSIRWKILGSISLTFLVAGVFVGVLGIFKVRKITFDDSILHMKNAARNVSLELTLEIKETENIVNLIRVRAENRGKVDRINLANEYFALLKSVLTTSIERICFLEECFIVLSPELAKSGDETLEIKVSKNVDGAFNIIKGNRLIEDFIEGDSSMSWYFYPKKYKKGVWSEPYYDKNMNLKLITYSVPIIIDNLFIGVAGANITVQRYYDIIKSNDLSPAEEIFLLSSENKILYGLTTDSIHKNNAVGIEAYVGNIIQVGKDGEMILFEDGGSRKNALFYILSNGWKFAIISSIRGIYKPADILVGGIILILIFGFWTALAVSVYLNKSIIEPINILITNMRNFAKSKIYNIDEKLINNNSKEIKNLIGQYSYLAGEITNSLRQFKMERDYYNIILDSINSLVVAVDLEGRIILFNKACEELSGYKYQEVAGMKYWDILLLKKDIEDAKLTFINKSFNSKTNFENQWIAKNGALHSIYWRFSGPIELDNNEKLIIGAGSDITDLKGKEMALQESEEKFRKLAESSPIAIMIYQGERLIYCNPFSIAELGYSEYELLNMNLLDFIHPDDREFVGKKILSRSKGNSVQSQYEIKVVTKSGGERWITLTSSHIEINNKPGGIIAAIDTTEKRKTEEALRISEAQLRSAMQSFPFDFWMCDNGGRYIAQNELSVQNWGDLVGKGVDELEIPDNVKELWETIISCALAGDVAIEEVEYIYMGGKKCFQNIAAPIRVEEKIIGLIGIGIDITERKLNEKALADYRKNLEFIVVERTKQIEKANNKLKNEVNKLINAEKKIQNQYDFLKVLIDSNPLPLFRCDADENIIGCNKSLLDLLGIKQSNVLNRKIYEVFPNDVAGKIKENFNALFYSSDRKNIETVILNFNSEPAEVLIILNAYKNLSGEIGGVLGHIVDITAQKKLQAEMEKALLREKELNDLKTRFISTVSHEFRTPLTAILSSADLLELTIEQGDLKKNKEYLKRIKRSVDSMTELLDDVLTINRAEVGKIVYKPTNFNFYEFCLNTIEEIKALSIFNHKLEFNYNLEFDSIYSDPKLLNQTLTNLLSNAVKYSPQKSKILFEVSLKNSVIEILVEDQGLGIPEKDQARLFDPFFRADNASGVYGTGLGLSIAKKAVELLKGNIYFSSKENQGARFIVQIPNYY